MNNIFIGYDDDAPIAYHVCVNSIISNTTKPIAIIPLALHTLPYTENHKDGSNPFIYSRFLIPYLLNYMGWAIFIDGDMILTNDITKLFEFNDMSKGVYVVKHSYTSISSVKYKNSINENYPRKNWSSVVVWNCSHPKHTILTPEFIQSSSGSFLHRFSWLNDDEIGELPILWNWLADEFGENQNANLIHFTLGTPCFNNYKNSPMSNLWHDEYTQTISCTDYE